MLEAKVSRRSEEVQESCMFLSLLLDIVSAAQMMEIAMLFVHVVACLTACVLHFTTGTIVIVLLVWAPVYDSR